MIFEMLQKRLIKSKILKEKSIRNRVDNKEKIYEMRTGRKKYHRRKIKDIYERRKNSSVCY